MNDLDDKTRRLFAVARQNGAAMFKDARGALRHPFIDPSGPYTGNLWDWDSFWAADALLHIARVSDDPALLERTRRHALGSLLNFFDHQGDDGSLPILMSVDDADWFDSVGHPENNMAKPVQALFLRLLADHDAVDPRTAVALLEKIRAAAECRNRRYLHADSGLLVWANDIAIGVDDDPAVWGRPDFSSAHIYYNSLLAMDLAAARDLAAAHGQDALHGYFRDEAERVAGAIDAYAYDRRDGWYYSCDVQCRQNLKPHRHFPPLNSFLTPFWKVLPIRIATFSGILPLVAGIASREQADAVARRLLDRDEFWCDYGIRTLSKAEDRFYEPTRFRGNPSNWLGPVWIISSYLAHRALKNYGYVREAEEIARNTVNLLMDDFDKTGVFHEYYSPEDGRPISGPGFLNWNLLALKMCDDRTGSQSIA